MTIVTGPITGDLLDLNLLLGGFYAHGLKTGELQVGLIP